MCTVEFEERSLQANPGGLSIYDPNAESQMAHQLPWSCGPVRDRSLPPSRNSSRLIFLSGCYDTMEYYYMYHSLNSHALGNGCSSLLKSTFHTCNQWPHHWCKYWLTMFHFPIRRRSIPPRSTFVQSRGDHHTDLTHRKRQCRCLHCYRSVQYAQGMA